MNVSATTAREARRRPHVPVTEIPVTGHHFSVDRSTLPPTGCSPVTNFHHDKEQTMTTIEFIGVRGGHGTTTVALAAAATLAARGPTHISAHDRPAMCAHVGLAADGLPIPLADNLELAADDERGDVVDAGTLQSYLDEIPFEGEAPIGSQKASGCLRIGVLRGPDYLGVRTLCDHAEADLDGLVVISEPGRALDARDVEHVSGRAVVAVIDHTPVVARTVDAGLFMHRVHRLREFAQLREWITQIVAVETSCTAST
ncbi:MAG: hypothetical protein V9E94_12145 [Microthrixaceae bacterium]|jgi:hypothetical protein